MTRHDVEFRVEGQSAGEIESQATQIADAFFAGGSYHMYIRTVIEDCSYAPGGKVCTALVLATDEHK